MAHDNSHIPAPSHTSLGNHPFDEEVEGDVVQRSAEPPMQLFEDNAEGAGGGEGDGPPTQPVPVDPPADLPYYAPGMILSDTQAVQHHGGQTIQFTIPAQTQVLIQNEIRPAQEDQGEGYIAPESYLVYYWDVQEGLLYTGEVPFGKVVRQTINGLDSVNRSNENVSGIDPYDHSPMLSGSRLATVEAGTSAFTADGSVISLDGQDMLLVLRDSQVHEGYVTAYFNNYQNEYDEANLLHVPESNVNYQDGLEPEVRGQDHQQNSFAVVQRQTWLVEMESNDQIEILPINTNLFIEQVDEFGWLHVRLDDGRVGRVDRTAIHGDPPVAGAYLYTIPADDNIETIFFNVWAPAHGGVDALKEQGGEEAGDPRYFANVLLHLNNPQGRFENTSVYEEGASGFDLRSLVQNYHRVRVRAGYQMWLPPTGYYFGLINEIAPGSIHGNVAHGIHETLDQYWPVGWGVMLDGSLGATFGIPVGLDGELGVEIIRSDDNTIQVRRRFSVWGGADTGVSAGMFIGSGESTRGNSEMNYGVGAQAGANARAGVRLYGLQEFAFPMDDQAILSALMTVSFTDTSSLVQGLYFVGGLSNYVPNPTDYLTNMKIQAGVEGELDAVATAGIKAGREDFLNTDTGRTADPRNGTTETGNFLESKILQRLSIVLQARYGISAATGIQIQTDEANPDILRASWYGEFISEAQAPAFLAPLFAVIPQASVAQTSYWTLDQSDPEAEWVEEGNSFKFFNGELDFYQGAASETELFFEGGSNITDIVNKLLEQFDGGNINVEELFALIHGMSFTNRFVLPLQIGFNYFRSRRFQDSVHRLLPENYQHKSVGAVGYFTVQYKLDPNLVGAEIQDLIEHYRPSFGDGAIMRVWEDLQGFLMNGEENEISDSFINIARGVVVLDATLRAEIGASIAAGASLSGGAKVRLQGHVGGAVIREENVLDLVVEVYNNNLEEFVDQFILERNLDLSFLDGEEGDEAEGGSSGSGGSGGGGGGGGVLMH